MGELLGESVAVGSIVSLVGTKSSPMGLSDMSGSNGTVVALPLPFLHDGIPGHDDVKKK